MQKRHLISAEAIAQFPALEPNASVLIPDGDNALMQSHPDPAFAPPTPALISKLAEIYNKAYNEAMDAIAAEPNHELIFEHHEEQIGCDISSFITGLCFAAGLTTTEEY